MSRNMKTKENVEGRVKGIAQQEQTPISHMLSSGYEVYSCQKCYRKYVERLEQLVNVSYLNGTYYKPTKDAKIVVR